jgi:hypothetical protein
MFTSEKQTLHYKRTEVRLDAEGKWLARRAACRLLGISAPTIRDWRLQGIPWLPGERLRYKELDDANGSHCYYLKTQLERIIKARADARADPAKWILVEEAARRFGWSDRRVKAKRPGRTLWRWLREGCPEIGGAVPTHEMRRVLIVDCRGREQSAEKMHVYLPDLERIAAAQAAKMSALCAELKERTPMAEAMKRLRVDRQWLRRRLKRCPERGAPLDAIRREVRRANDYRQRRIFDYFILTAHLDELERARQGGADVYTDKRGDRWFSRSAALTESGKRFPHLTARVLQCYPQKECPQLDYQVLHRIKRPLPAGKGGRYGLVDYFLEDELIRLKSADATRRKPAEAPAAGGDGASLEPITSAGSATQSTPKQRKKREEETHLLWQKWHVQDGLSYQRIVQKQKDENGEIVTRSAVVMALHRLRERCSH